MGQLILRTAISVDGYIATSSGSRDRVASFGLDNEVYDFQSFYENISAIVMGRSAYQQLHTFGDPFPYDGKHVYVFTRNKHLEQDAHVTYITSHIPAFIRSLKEETQGDIRLVGGGLVNGLLMSYGLIDQCELFILPTVIGTGIQLFAGNIKRQSVALQQVNRYQTGVVKATYVFA